LVRSLDLVGDIDPPLALLGRAKVAVHQPHEPVQPIEHALDLAQLDSVGQVGVVDLELVVACEPVAQAA
jgi:hypothetical protein